MARHGRPAAPLPAAEVSLPGRAKWVVGGIIGGSAAAGLLAAGSSALALYFAHRVITPARVRDEDQEILAVIKDGQEQRVILAATPTPPWTVSTGFFFDGGRGHARIGRILSYSPAERTVMREVEAVTAGDLSTARRGWWSGAAYPEPAGIGLAAEEVLIDVDGGTAPAWLRAPAPPGRTSGPSWCTAVALPGTEGLRAVRTAQDLGMTSLLISYRNDGLAPSATDGRYGLGIHRVARRRSGHRLCPGAGRPRGRAVRLVDGRRHQPADGGPLPATTT